MPLLLPTLPFRCVFDILFLHAGADHLARLFGQDNMSAALESLQRRSPLWVEVLLTCCLVRRLEHPAHALLLLEPVDTAFPDSVRAWSVSRLLLGLCRPCPRALVLAMKAFLPRRGDVYEWLDVSSLKRRRTLAEWRLLAKRTISNHRYTLDWRRRCECVDDEPMGMTICRLADDEAARLMGGLEQEHLDRLLSAKRARRDERMRVEKRMAPPVRVTPNETQRIREDAEQRRESHLRLLAEVQRSLETMSADAFDRWFGRIVDIVASLGREHPRIRWNLRLRLHSVAAYREDRAVWPTEHALDTSAACVHEPMDALRALAAQ